MASAADVGAHLPCLACRPIVPDRSQLDYLQTSTLKTPFERDDLYPAFPGVASSARAGCSLCALMWRRLTSIPPEATEAINKVNNKLVWVSSVQRTRQLEVSWDRKVKLRAYFDFLPHPTASPSGSIRYERAPTPEDGDQRGGAVTSIFINFRPTLGRLRLGDGNFWAGETFEFPIFDSIDLHSPRLEWRRTLPSPITLSSNNVTKIKSWIDSCLSNHSQCSTTQITTDWIPKRLLEVTNGGNGLRVRLVESLESNLNRGAKFAALSHVWGDLNASPPLRLLTSNFSQLKKGIQEYELPRNFLEASHVCARLGIQYLWIDSLCIIQNSVDDWKEQALLMHLVYSHALITIVATSAKSCHDGFLERDIELTSTAMIAYSLPVEGERSASDGGYMIIYDYDNPLDIWRMHAINGSKWNTRAWTMQERSLSTRMVHFCQNKIFFECRGCLQSEENEPVQQSDVFNSTLWPRSPSASLEELHQHWQLCVSEYTSRNLTVSTDKLPAIQSVAEEMAAATGQKYIRFAGMWLSNLQRELLWFVMMGKATRPDTWRAPSWSWAAVEGQISLWQRDFRNAQQSRPGTLLNRVSLHHFAVLEVDQDYRGPQSINPGFLRVRSLIKRFGRLQSLPVSEKGRSFFPYNLIVEESLERNESGNNTVTFAHGKLDFDNDTDIGTSTETLGVFLYLHVNNNARATGLILRPQIYGENGKPHSWERLETPILDDAFNLDDAPQVVTLT
ncbi:heterokaryon incompatibility protein-domain-containing protein [Xylaria palmicola]|nr:heterokaryon incompatibility protein-domain-containing protein [Xylaria palmicola]